MEEITKDFKEDKTLSITKYIVENHNIKLSVKLQKILYFLYLDYLKENNKKLFNDNFEAWVYGPVLRKVFSFIQANGFDFSEYFDSENNKIVEIKELDDKELKKFIDTNISKYKKCSTEKLVAISHKTMPWEKARKNLSYDVPSNEIIKFTDLKKFVKTWVF